MGSVGGCLVGCVKDYTCGQIQKGQDADVLSPFVRISFGKDPSDPDITVGNKSAPPFDHHAIIKSFEAGQSTGAGIKVEIIDEEGGMFHLFADKMWKCMGTAKLDLNMRYQWGWVASNCTGGSGIIGGVVPGGNSAGGTGTGAPPIGTVDRQAPALSPVLTALLVDMEVTFAEGKVKFSITGTDSLTPVFVSRFDDIEGDDSQKIPLKQAIRNLLINKEPKMNVRFARINPDGTESEWPFQSPFGMQGPEAVWDCDGQNKLATIMKWLEPFMTDRDKGVTAVWDAASDELVLLEDPGLGCNESVGCDASIGTWIVNGGKCSPVIDFTPTINWAIALTSTSSEATGNAGGPATGATQEKTKSRCPVQSRETGIVQNIAATRYGWEAHGPKEVINKTEKSQNAHDTAASGSSIETKKAIEAEIRIQGDPRKEFAVTLAWAGKYMSLVVINPFHIFGFGNGGCGDWLAIPGCNEILSNKRWRIQGVSHQIKEGSYTTTIKLQLDDPGVSIEAGQPMGGPGSGGYVPPNTC